MEILINSKLLHLNGAMHYSLVEVAWCLDVLQIDYLSSSDCCKILAVSIRLMVMILTLEKDRDWPCLDCCLLDLCTSAFVFIIHFFANDLDFISVVLVIYSM